MDDLMARDSPEDPQEASRGNAFGESDCFTLQKSFESSIK